MVLEFEKNGIKHTFTLRDIPKEEHYIEFIKNPDTKYLDLTTDATKTSTTDIAFDQNGIPHYIRNLYSTFLEKTGSVEQQSISWGGSRAIEISVDTEGYEFYSIGINCNFSLRHVEDRSGSSTNNNYQWDGNLKKYNGSYFTDSSDSVRPMPVPSKPNDITENNISNSEILINGNVRDLTTNYVKEKEITFQYWITSYFQVYIKKLNNKIYVKMQFTGGGADRLGSLISYNGIVGIKIYD